MIAIDGKSLKGAYDKGEKSSPKMMVSAYAAGLRLTLATVAAEERNEVDAALEVLGLIDLKSKIVTGDALHCNRRMVELIVEKGGDYCIALKGNQDSLLSDELGECHDVTSVAGANTPLRADRLYLSASRQYRFTISMLL